MLFKKHIVVLVTVCMLCMTACTPASDTSKEPMDLGIPAASYFEDNCIARCVWDMTIFDNKLYVGCGDYNVNTGGVPVLYCDLDDLGNWQEEAFLYDEQIGRFLEIDGKLTVPGWDPVVSLPSGSYYQLENGEWQTIVGLPDGLHNFDLVRFDGKLFAGIGADRGETPIAVSEDGKKFERVPMLRNGEPIDTSEGELIRTYNLWVLNDTLYADFHYVNTVENKKIVEVYRYENGQFIWCVGLGKKLNMASMGSQCLGTPWADAVIDDTLFVTTGHLYMTTDMVEFTDVSFPNYTWTYDLYTYNDTLYALAASQDADGFHVKVYSTTTADPDGFTEELALDHPLQPTSLAVSAEGYFIAFGNWYNMKTEQNGQVLYLAKD